MKLKNIAQIIGTSLQSKVTDSEINWLLTDSRSLSFPAESLFFAIKTARNNGHKYIAGLYEQNLRYFVVSEIRPEFEELTDAVFLLVSDTLVALQKLASVQRSTFNVPVIGITAATAKRW